MTDPQCRAIVAAILATTKVYGVERVEEHTLWIEKPRDPAKIMVDARRFLDAAHEHPVTGRP